MHEAHSIEKNSIIFFVCFFQLDSIIIFSRYYNFENHDIYFLLKSINQFTRKLFSDFLSNSHNSYKNLIKRYFKKFYINVNLL